MSLLWRLAAAPVTLLVLLVALSLLYLSPWGPELTDDRLSALWVLLASLVATIGALIGALLTASSEERTRELEREREERQGERDAAQLQRQREVDVREAAERKTIAERQRLEATIQGIRIFEVAPENRIMAAGAFAMVVELGKLEVALRMLGPALTQRDVDANTAAWVLDRVMREPAENIDFSAKEHAAFLLLENHAQFINEHVAGSFQWPASLVNAWPSGLSANTGGLALLALCDLLTSKTRTWWTREAGDWEWSLVTLYTVIRDEEEESLKSMAATILRTLMSEHAAHWQDHWILGEDFQIEIQKWPDLNLGEARRQRLRAWMRNEVVSQPSFAEVSELTLHPTTARD